MWFSSPEATHLNLAKLIGVHYTQYAAMLWHYSANELHLPQPGKHNETLG